MGTGFGLLARNIVVQANLSMETIVHHAPLEHSVRRMHHLARNAQPTPSLGRELVHAQTVSLGQPLIRGYITIIATFHY